MQFDAEAYKYNCVIEYKGKVFVLYAVKVPGKNYNNIVYRCYDSALEAEAAADNTQLNDDDLWASRQILTFPTCIEPANLSLLRCPVRILNGQSDSDNTTLSSSVDAPFQVLTDGEFLYVFRVSIWSTLLVDRFNFDETNRKLVPAVEVRYQRSENKDLPAGKNDTFASRSLENNPFIAATVELIFDTEVYPEKFSVELIDTHLPSVSMWTFLIIKVNKNKPEKDKVAVYSLAKTTEGLFDTTGANSGSCFDSQGRKLLKNYSLIFEGGAKLISITTELYSQHELALSNQSPGTDISSQATMLKRAKRLIAVLTSPVDAKVNNTYVVDFGISNTGHLAYIASKNRKLKPQEIDDWSTTLFFNGRTSYVESNHELIMNIPQNFTFETWVKFANALESQSNDMVLLSVEAKDKDEVTFRVYFANNSRILIEISSATNTNTPILIETEIKVQPVTWYHVAIVYDNTKDPISYEYSFNKKYQIYLNGSQKPVRFGGDKQDPLPTLSAPSMNNKLRLGSKIDGDYFAGSIKAMRLWSSARTSEQIFDNMSKKMLSGTSSDATNLKLYWLFTADNSIKLGDGYKGDDIISYNLQAEAVDKGSAKSYGAQWISDVSPISVSSTALVDNNNLSINLQHLTHVNPIGRVSLLNSTDGKLHMYYRSNDSVKDFFVAKFNSQVTRAIFKTISYHFDNIIYTACVAGMKMNNCSIEIKSLIRKADIQSCIGSSVDAEKIINFWANSNDEGAGYVDALGYVQNKLLQVNDEKDLLMPDNLEGDKDEYQKKLYSLSQAPLVCDVKFKYLNDDGLMIKSELWPSVPANIADFIAVLNGAAIQTTDSSSSEQADMDFATNRKLLIYDYKKVKVNEQQRDKDEAYASKLFFVSADFFDKQDNRVRPSQNDYPNFNSYNPTELMVPGVEASWVMSPVEASVNYSCTRKQYAESLDAREIIVRKSLSKSNALDIQRDLSLEAWVNYESLYGEQTIIAYSGDFPYVLGLKDRQIIAAKGGISEDNAALVQKSVKITEKKGKWQHIAAVYHGGYGLDLRDKLYVDCGNNQSMNLGKSFTIEGWFKPNTNESLAEQVLLSKWDDDSPEKSWKLFTDRKNSKLGMRLRRAKGKDVRYKSKSVKTLTSNIWSHIAVSCDFSETQVNVLRFDGEETYVAFGTEKQPQLATLPQNGFCIEFWFKMINISDNQVIVGFSPKNRNSQNDESNPFLFSLVFNGDNNCLEINFGGERAIQFTKADSKDTSYRHVAISVSKDKNNKAVVAVYINGQPVVSFQENTLQNYPGDGDGCWRFGDNWNMDQYKRFSGDLHEFRVWNTLRLEEEIVDNYTDELVPENYPSLIGYWLFSSEEGSKQTTVYNLVGEQQSSKINGKIIDHGGGVNEIEVNWTALKIKNPQLSIFINGELDVAYMLPEDHELNASSAPLLFARQQASTLANNNIFTGCIDDVRIWSSARTESQIAYHMENPLLNSNGQKDLVCYWPCDEGAGRTVRDIKGNNDGTMRGVNEYMSSLWIPVATNKEHDSYAVSLREKAYIDFGKDDLDINSSEEQWLTALTCETWIYPEEENGVIISQWTTAETICVGWRLLLENSRLKFDAGYGNNNVDSVNTSSEVKLREWMHVSVVYAGAKYSEQVMIKIYINGVEQELESNPLSSSASIKWPDVPMTIGRQEALQTEGANYFTGKIDSLRIWTVDRSADDISSDVSKTYDEIKDSPNLSRSYEFNEGRKRQINDSKNKHIGLIKNVRYDDFDAWLPTKFGAYWEFYLNGRLIQNQYDTPIVDPEFTFGDGDEQLTIAAKRTISSNEDSNHEQYFTGKINEVRVWSAALTSQQINALMYNSLGGDETALVGYWPAGVGSATTLIDCTKNANDLFLKNAPDWIWPDKNTNTSNTIVPTQEEIPAVTDVSNKFKVAESTPLHLTSLPVVTETSSLSRIYTFISDKVPSPVSDLKNDDSIILKDASKILNINMTATMIDLDMIFISQVQFEPTVTGYIEGAPPVPSENLSIQAPSNPDKYVNASSIKLTQSNSKIYTYSASRNKGLDMVFDEKHVRKNSFGTRTGVDISNVNLILGTGFEFDFENTDTKFVKNSGMDIAAISKYEHSQDWGAAALTVVGYNTLQSVEMAFAGAFINNVFKIPGSGSDLLSVQPKQLYWSNNMGLAVVKSRTADLFGLRSRKTSAIIGYSMQVDPSIPEDSNLIPFKLNSDLIRNGTLDGNVGFDKYYPDMTAREKRSYFKPAEAYGYKRDIERKQKRLEIDYDDFDAGSIGRRTSATHFTQDDPAKGNLSAILDEEAKENLTQKEWKETTAQRDLCNTYVWAADGGLYAEEMQFTASRSEQLSGGYNFKGQSGISFGLNKNSENKLFNVAMEIEAGFQLDSLFGGHIVTTATKAKNETTSSELDVSVIGDGFLNQRTMPLENSPVYIDNATEAGENISDALNNNNLAPLKTELTNAPKDSAASIIGEKIFNKTKTLLTRQTTKKAKKESDPDPNDIWQIINETHIFEIKLIMIQKETGDDKVPTISILEKKQSLYADDFSSESLPGTVRSYRFMSFYFDPDKDNFSEFKSIIDQDWLSEKSGPDPNAWALRSALSRPNAIWRVCHRVTYVDRVPLLNEGHWQSGEDVVDKIERPDSLSLSNNAAILKFLGLSENNPIKDYDSLQYKIESLLDNYAITDIRDRQRIIANILTYSKNFSGTSDIG